MLFITPVVEQQQQARLSKATFPIEDQLARQ